MLYSESVEVTTISHMVRYILSSWTNEMRKGEKLSHNRDLNRPGLNNQATTGNVKTDRALWDRYLTGQTLSTK